MTLEELTQTIVQALDDVKAKDVKVFNTEALTDQFERVVIASGASNRQTRALAYAVSAAVKEAAGEEHRKEGQRANGCLSTAAAWCAMFCSRMFATITTLRKFGAAKKSS